VTTPAGVEAHVATGALMVVTVDRVVGLGVTTGAGDGVGFVGSGGGVPVHSTQYSLPTSRAEHNGRRVVAEKLVFRDTPKVCKTCASVTSIP
jgi:hypothetical protein